MRYVKIRSWHIVKTPTRFVMFDTYITLCNRTVTTTETSNDFGDEKTCETCFRKQARINAAT